MRPIYHKEISILLKYFEKTLQAFLKINDDIKNGSNCRTSSCKGGSIQILIPGVISPDGISRTDAKIISTC
jgi:hypothetical protein